MIPLQTPVETEVSATPEQVGEGVWRVTGGAFASNAYICGGRGGDGFIVDPGLDPERIDQAAKALEITPRQVFCTHGHFDHIGGAHHFQQAYGAEVFLHPADLKTMKGGNFLLMVLKLDQRITLPTITPMEAGAHLPTADGGSLVYRPVPGHTPGSYARGVGLSKLPGEDHALLRKSLLSCWNDIEDHLLIHPGHGPSARFAAIRDGNLALRRFLAVDGEAG